MPLSLRVVLASLLLTGCSVTSGDLTCVFKTNGTVSSCGEWSNAAVAYRSTIETLCRTTGSDFSTGHNCPADGRIGGCSATSSDGDGITWYYSSDKTKTLADVKVECGADKKLLDASGKVVEGGLACSMPGATVVVVHFVNKRSAPISVYYRDMACVDGFKVMVEADPAKRQLVPSRSGDVYLVRDGNMNASGTVLKELTVGTANPEIVEIN